MFRNVSVQRISQYNTVYRQWHRRASVIKPGITQISIKSSNNEEAEHEMRNRKGISFLTVLTAGIGICVGYKFYKFLNCVNFSALFTVSALSDNGKRNKSLNLRKTYNFIADVVEVAAPSVVYIEIKNRQRKSVFSGEPPTVSNGSGFIVKEDGLILTNAHVVVNKPNCSVHVKLHDGKSYVGKIEYVDMRSDLATIRIPCKNLPTLKLGSSNNIMPGEWVVAIGSPLSLSNTITCGVVSSVNRASTELGLQGRDMDYIQTDAAITFGNSGGPLVNLDGEAIGINSMKVTAGISFAIPIDYAKEFLRKSEAAWSSKGTNEPSGINRRYLGLTMLSLTPEIISELRQRNQFIPPNLTQGVLIVRVVLGSPAFNAGIKPGDIIVGIGERPAAGAVTVYEALNSSAKELTLTILREHQRFTVTVCPEEPTL